MTKFWGVLPGPLRLDRKVHPNAKLLFVEITALSGRDGYCRAKNKYLCELVNVEERSVKRYLKSLLERGHIQIVFSGTERRIYPAHHLQIILRKRDGTNLTPQAKEKQNPEGTNLTDLAISGKNNLLRHNHAPIVPMSIKDTILSTNRKKVQYEQCDIDFIAYAITRWKSLYPNMKIPQSLNPWYDIIRLMRTQDDRSMELIRANFDYAMTDSFESTVILSPRSLRKGYDRIEAKRLAKQRRYHVPSTSTPKTAW